MMMCIKIYIKKKIPLAMTNLSYNAQFKIVNEW
jgi:hypothetical protein